MTRSIVSSVLFNTRSGRSAVGEAKLAHRRNIDDFAPKRGAGDRSENELRRLGFEIIARSDVGMSMVGPAMLYDLVLEGTSRDRVRPSRLRRGLLERDVEAIELAPHPVYFHDAVPPTPGGYYLDVLQDVPALLGCGPVHAAGTRGTGVRVSMLDTGFITQVSESRTSSSQRLVTTEHPILAVEGVYRASTNHYTAGSSFVGNEITLASSLGGAQVDVVVVYSCVHPFFTNLGISPYRMAAVPGSGDVMISEDPHGIAVAANLLATAPGCTFSFVKGTGAAAFQLARSTQNPDIISCSWGTQGHSAALHLEIASTVAAGTVVVFSAGGGTTDVSDYEAIAHPDVISVGGVYPIQGGGLRASNFASSFDSFRYSNPQRHVPDVCGLVGEQPDGSLIMLPTQPSTPMDDGWAVLGGTSAAAAQVAGVTALLLERFPDLSPSQVRNILQNSATDVVTGNTDSVAPDAATAGWDPATGFGLVNAQAAVEFLHKSTIDVYIRDSVEDDGTEPVVTERLWTSPDIIVRTQEVEDLEELGASVKHRQDLSDDVELGQDNYVYVRVQNRGRQAGDCTVKVYFTDPGAFGQPSLWTPIGELVVPSLSPGEFRVAGPITWSSASIPGTGHYCLISTLASVSDPAPDLATIVSSDAFTAMVRDRNNVAWKNVIIRDLAPGGYSNFEFHVEAPTGSNHVGTLGFELSGFVRGGKVLARVAKRLTEGAEPMGLTAKDDSKLFRSYEVTHPQASLLNMPLASSDRTVVRVDYSVPENARDGDYPLRVTFRVDGMALGGLTHVVRLSRSTFIGNRSTRELHRRGCPWHQRMATYNQVPFRDLEQAHRLGFDNCAFCLGDSKR